jgi:hypothetical protein
MLAALVTACGCGKEKQAGDDKGSQSGPAGEGTSKGVGHASLAEEWPAWPESASVEVGEAIKLSCPVLVYSTPEEVWDTLVTARRFFLWYPHWKRETNLMRRLTAVGDTVAYHRRGERVGCSAVTALERLRKLVISHELEDGGWAGAIHISMEVTERGVGFLYEESYPPPLQDIEDRRKQVCKRVILIKRLAEGE